MMKGRTLNLERCRQEACSGKAQDERTSGQIALGLACKGSMNEDRKKHKLRPETGDLVLTGDKKKMALHSGLFFLNSC